jgi:hypothetical protein
MIVFLWVPLNLYYFVSNDGSVEQVFDIRVIAPAAQLYIYDLIHSQK